MCRTFPAMEKSAGSALRKEGTVKFYKPLYIGDAVRKPDRIKRKLRRGKLTPGIYVLLWDGENSRLEMYNSLMLQQPYYKDQELYVIGIASGEDEGLQLIARMAEESWKKTGKVDFAASLFDTGL